jgi:mRNA-degrading endonuclease RelE of RelBE toxin-antitoxin system
VQYTVAIVPKAEKEFLALPSTARNRIREKILALEDNPKPFGSKKLRQTDYYRPFHSPPERSVPLIQRRM